MVLSCCLLELRWHLGQIGAPEVFESQDPKALVFLLDLEVMGRDLGARHRRRPDDCGRSLLDLTAGADHAAGPAADQMTRPELFMNGGQDPLAMAQVRGPCEQQAEITRSAQLPGRIRRRLGKRLDRIEALGESNGDPDGHA